MAWKYGRIYSQLPIMAIPFQDPGLSRVRFEPKGKVTRSTATIVLTKDFFYFGDLEAFTEKFADVRNKFFVPHIDGRPEVSILLDTMTRWMKVRSTEKKPVGRDVVILLPSAEIPLPIVIQVLHWIKKSGIYDEAVLASELQ
jgi:hypothetical protein